jgi:hypothetical protein
MFPLRRNSRIGSRSRSFTLALVALATLGAATASFASLVQINLEVPDLVLKNGARYHDLTVRTFDPAIGRVMIQSGKTFTTLAITDFPDDLAAKLRSLTPPSAAEPEKPSTVVPAPVIGHRNAPDETAASSRPDPSEAKQERDEAHAKAAIIARAQNYFRYESSVGSGSVTIQSLKFEWQAIEPVPGWTGRYRMAGRAYLDYFDSVGNSFSRTQRDFEMSAEVDAHGNAKVVDVTNH